MVAAAAAPAALPILMGASLATTAVGTGLQIKANNDAFKNQQNATQTELNQIYAATAEEDRQATQAAEEEKRRIKAEIAEALGTTEGWALLSFLESPHGALEGHTPRQAIEQGRAEQAIAIAEHEGN